MSARSVVRSLTPYTLELREAGIKLNQNESPFDLPADLKREVLARVAGRPWNVYPDFEAVELRTEIARAFGLAPENVLAGNGSNELLAATIGTFVGPGTPVVMPQPAFALYEKLVAIAGGVVTPVAIDPACGRLPLEAMLRALDGLEGAVAIVCSPNNPTGGLLSVQTVGDLLATGATVILDRAYADFAGEPLPALHDRLVALSTFSKAWGLAALRVGWLASTEATCREIRKVKLPYSLNIVSEAVAIAALRRPEIRNRNVAATVAERERLIEGLRSIDGIEVFPSFANFVTFRTGNAKETFERLAAGGVLVRDVSGYAGLGGCLRVSVGTPEQNDAFLQLLAGRTAAAVPVREPRATRVATVERTTKETSVRLTVDLDGSGRSRIDTPIGFLSHMLDAIARHAQIDLDAGAAGDVEIDYHHTVEDTALVFGEAVRRALGEKKGIRRFGSACVPLDESLARVVIDFSGRPYFVFEVPLDREMLLIHKDFPFALVEEFFKSFANACACNIHVDLIRGRNGHHAAEAIFKAFALALREAKEVRGEAIPSTKGVL